MLMLKVVSYCSNYLKNRKSFIMIIYLFKNIPIFGLWRNWSWFSVGLTHKFSFPIVFASHVTNPDMKLAYEAGALNLWWKFAFVTGFGFKLGSKMNNVFELRILTAKATWYCHSAAISFPAFSVMCLKYPKIKCFFGGSKFFPGNFSSRYWVRWCEKRRAR